MHSQTYENNISLHSDLVGLECSISIKKEHHVIRDLAVQSVVALLVNDSQDVKLIYLIDRLKDS